MLFNSYEFIFYFLVPVYVFFIFLKKSSLHVNMLIWFLTFVSVVFYGEWSLKHLGILLVSVFVNFAFAKALMRKNMGKKRLLGAGIVLNLVPLVYFKIEGSLPLAISFFTFQQIAFLVDVYKRKIQLEGLREYSFFVLFFPQLVAGPIVHYNELIPQIKENLRRGFHKVYFHKGIVLFSMGLFKKVVLADSLANITADGWAGLFAYTFKIYFDFSGYTDMALGLGLLFGVRLPINFNSPYKSVNIVEFWRRWHITLSHFLRDYIYIPLGGNRAGKLTMLRNLFLTMLLGGAWHGVGWNFVIWGALHGALLAFVHSFKWQLPKYLAICITFLSVSLLWVFFKSENFSAAMDAYGMLFRFDTFGAAAGSEMFLLGLSWFIVWFLPNSHAFVRYEEGTAELRLYHAAVAGVMFFVALKVLAVSPARTFVYFNF